MIGIVKSYNEKRGFGFIKPDNDDKDIFFHISCFDADLQPQENMVVSFNIEQNERGPRAVQITSAK